LFIAFGVCFAIAFISVGLAAQMRYPILFIISFSLFAIFLGSFEQWGSPGAVYAPQMFGGFTDAGFWEVFAVFFPAVTGILAGVNMSGTLENPRQNIPKGTITAVLLTFLIYMLLAYWTSRVATPDELKNNFLILIDKAAFGWAIQAAILAATFSAALNSLVGAPRVLQAMAAHDVVPFSKYLAQETASGEPRQAMYLTGVIGIATLLFGLSGDGLNQIAPLMTMFFLITYAILNGVVVLEQILSLTSFRPLFPIPRLVPLIGFIGALFVMFLINPIFSLISLIVILVLYEYLSLQQLKTPWSDVRSGMFVTLAEWAAKRVLKLPSGQQRAWKPSLLVPVKSDLALRYSYRFLEAITQPNGSLHIVGCYQDGNRSALAGLRSYEQTFANDGIFARVAFLETREFMHTLQTAIEMSTSAFFRPNSVFIPVMPDDDEPMLQSIVDHAVENRMGVILYVDNPHTGLGREQVINVWLREQSPAWSIGLKLPNLDLSLLLGYQLARNWNGRINLITVVSAEAERENAERYLHQLMDLGRMPRGTRPIVCVGTFGEQITKAPDADLQIFGLQANVQLGFLNDVMTQTKSSCIVVRDSGEESALV